MTKKQILFSFKGRINRSKYWLGTLLTFLILLLPILIFAIFGAVEIIAAISQPNEPLPEWMLAITSGTGKTISTAITMPLLILGAWAIFAVTAKRFHDMNLPGWICLPFVIIGSVLLFGLPYLIGSIIIGCIDGTKGENKYGPDPVGQA